MGVIGALLGAGQAYCGIKFFTYEDPRIEEVNGRLPNANCGACGIPGGCKGLAEQVVAGKVNPGACTVASTEAKESIAELLGIVMEDTEKKSARLACGGGFDTIGDLSAVHTCRDADRAGGGKGCVWGCIGLGDCERVCHVRTFDAIVMSAHGLPVVDHEKCVACGACVLECPKGLLSLVPDSVSLWVACKNMQKGQPAKEKCHVACTACGNCATDAAPGLIHIGENNLAVIDYESGCPQTEAAIKNCPTGAIVFSGKK